MEVPSYLVVSVSPELCPSAVPDTSGQLLVSQTPSLVFQEEQVPDLSISSSTVANKHTSPKQGRGKHLQLFHLLIPPSSDKHFDGFFKFQQKVSVLLVSENVF